VSGILQPGWLPFTDFLHFLLFSGAETFAPENNQK